MIGTGISFLGAIVAAWGGIASSRQEAALITGGDGFCYLVAYPLPSSSPIMPMIINESQYTIYDIYMRVLDLGKPFQPAIVERRIVGAGSTYPIGNLPPHSERELGITFPGESGTRRFNIFFAARNGFFSESLRLMSIEGVNGGKWTEALQVSRSDKVLLVKIDPKFPRGPNGKVVW